MRKSMTRVNVLSTKPAGILRHKDKMICGLLLHVLHQASGKAYSLFDFIPPLNDLKTSGAGSLEIFKEEHPIRQTDVCGVLDLLAQEGLAIKVTPDEGTGCGYVPTQRLHSYLYATMRDDADLESMAVSVLVSL
jgi:hypothetical protein